MKFLDAIRELNEEARGLTENGAPTFTTTFNKNLDFFALASSKRGRILEVKELFNKAIEEDTELAILNLFYLRDVRGGQGERESFRQCLELIPEKYLKDSEFLKFIPEYGRWDDLEVLFSNKNLISSIMKVIKDQLTIDEHAQNPSLLAKWIPLPNSVSNKNRKSIGYTIIHQLYGTILNSAQRIFRNRIVRLRNKIDLVEHYLSTENYEGIDYSKVPSCAFNKYKSAFNRNDFTRFSQFIQDVASGKKKLNANCIYPHQIVNQMRCVRDANKQVLEEMWKNIPDMGIKGNILTVVDVSGSMYCSVSHLSRFNAVDVSLGLGIYTSERNRGLFHNHIISFSSEPTLLDLSRFTTTKQKIEFIEREGQCGYNTNVQKVFDLILNAIIRNNIPPEERPTTVLIVSDMEFDRIECQGYSVYDTHNKPPKTNFEEIKSKFSQAGIKLPQLIFWNVCSRGTNIPVRQNEQGVTLVSGFSPSTLKFVTSEGTPLEFMMSVLSSERYSPIMNYLKNC